MELRVELELDNIYCLKTMRILLPVSRSSPNPTPGKFIFVDELKRRSS